MTEVTRQAIAAQAPASRLVLVTKGDADQGPYRALRLYVASGPITLKVRGMDDVDVTLTVPEGVYWEPITVKRIWSTGSSGTVIIHGAL